MGFGPANEEAPVKCVICKEGETRPGTTTITLQRGPTTVVFRGVPALICENCGEEYVEESVTSQLLELAEEAARSGSEIEIRDYAA